MKELQKVKNINRQMRKARIRAKVHGTQERPRLVVFCGLRNTHAQLIDDESGHVLASAYSKEIKSSKATKTEIAKKVGLLIAQKGQEKSVKAVVFDRSAKKYHGRVKAVADGAREGGLAF